MLIQRCTGDSKDADEESGSCEGGLEKPEKCLRTLSVVFVIVGSGNPLRETK